MNETALHFSQAAMMLGIGEYISLFFLMAILAFVLSFTLSYFFLFVALPYTKPRETDSTSKVEVKKALFWFLLITYFWLGFLPGLILLVYDWILAPLGWAPLTAEQIQLGYTGYSWETPIRRFCYWLWVFVALIFTPLYTLPSLIALKKQKTKYTAIACLNLLAGWTFFGYVAALVWALTEDDKKSGNK